MLYIIKIITDQIIISAINSINHILESRVHFSNDGTDDPLIDTRNLLQRLLEPDSPKNELTQLFYRQLNRLMHYNRSLSNTFWTELHNDILYLLDESNGKEATNNSVNQFLKRINLERNLEQRELQFYQTFGKQKSFRELFCEHKTFFQDYLHKCISLHSKIQVQDLLENIDHLLYNVYKLTDVSLISERKTLLNEKLKCIEIDLDSSNRKLTSLDSQFYIDDNSYKEVNNTLNNFLPSIEQLPVERSFMPEKIAHVLQCDRWIVILGDPGSGKTTLLQWIMHIFAQAAHSDNEYVILEEDDRLPIRIPILIRIGEFAAWLVQNQTRTLIDYIGEHTWFSEHYCNDENKSVLKELIHHGHALILLDGLDEISEVRRRGEIVDLTRKFIDQYVRSSDYLSTFDNRIFNIEASTYGTFVDAQPPSISGGNQIVITSRIVGYQLFPLIGPHMKHYSLLLMNHTEAKEFVKNWISQAENGVLNILLNEEIKFEKETMKILLTRQDNTVEAIFENSSKFLMSNPFLLSLICPFIFQLSDEFHWKSRIEVYHHAVQTALHSCENQQSNIPKSVLTDFLIELASYLHLQSPSGLIDAFDMEHMCYLILRRQDMSNNRTELREQVSKLICLLESNIVIVSQRGLQVFGFLHLSFQEYFVAQSFLRDSSIEKIVKRILTFTIHSRFHESLLFALGWISWKWSDDDYDKFCILLFEPSKDYVIPFGTLLFFDAFNDIQKLPSKSILFIAINNLFDHLYNVLRRRLLSLYLPKFDTNTIMEWMQSHLKDDKCIFKFCQSIALECSVDHHMSQNVHKLVSPSVCHQLWLLHDKSSSAEFIIDQTLRKIIISDGIPNEIFNKKLSSYLLSDNVCISNIHPLILSVIIAVCGGVHFDSQEGLSKIDFSPKKMHHESSILNPIMEYLHNNKESHSIKIQTLVQRYENILQTFLPSDTSLDIVDTFIALICLQSVSQPLIYQKYDGYQALSLAIDRLKRTWFYLKKPCDSFSYAYTLPDISLITSDLESIMDEFFSQSSQFDEQDMSFLLVCISPWQKLGMWEFSRWLNSLIRNEMINRYFQCPPAFSHLINEDELDEMIKNIHSQQILQQKPIFLLPYLPQSLQQLYYYTIISPIDKTDSLPLVVLLSHCLTHLEDVNKNDLSAYLVLPMLHPLLKEHMLENYASVLFREKYWDSESIPIDHIRFLNAIKDRQLLDPFLIDQPIDWEILISIERQRICEAKDIVQQEEKDLRLLAASISLARLFQGRYHSRRYQRIKQLNLSILQSKEVHFAIMNILNPVLRTIALSIILYMEDPLIFDEEQRDELQFQTINQLQSLLPCLPLMTATLLFVCCHSVRRLFPASFLQMANVIAGKFNQNTTDKQTQSQEAAYIALRQLNDSNLSHCLSKFAKQTKNLSDLLRFNSTIVFRYFTNTISFNSSNTILLSLIYLIELSFDAPILKMYTNDNDKSQISSFEELNQLWNHSPKSRNVITFEVATWITNHLEILNKKQLHQIIERVSKCLIIKKKALPLIEKWLNYRMNKDLTFFAQYAALQLTIEGNNVPDLIDIINNMFNSDTELDLPYFIERLFNSRYVKSNTIRQIIIGLHRNIHYLQKTAVLIDLKETLELILSLEFERITENVHQSSTTSTTPFLCMIRVSSEDLQYYLVEYLRKFVNTQNEIENNIKEEYLSVVIKWIIQSSIGQIEIENFSKELLDYIFILLHDQQFPQVQKAIINSICSLFIENSVWVKTFLRTRKSIWQKHVFMEENTIDHLEKMIDLWNTYSEDLLLVSLLAYGKCLLMLHTVNIHRNISNEMQDLLTTLIDTSSSEVISIRAALCLILSQNKKIKSDKTWDWFKNKWNITPEKTYQILLQQILYEEGIVSETSLNELVEYLKTYSSELLGTFINELYNYLCNKENVNYLSNPIPDYISIALKISTDNFDAFRKTLQKTFFGEEKLKRELYLYYVNKRTGYASAIKLYVAFGMITVDLIHMIELLNEDGFNCKWIYLEEMKQVSDEGIVDRLFQLLDLMACSMKIDHFNSIVRLLVHLAQNHTVSLLEVHQRLSSIIKKILCENNSQVGYDEKCIFDQLLDLSCFKDDVKRDIFLGRICTENDINEAFQKKVLDLDKNLVLFHESNIPLAALIP